MVRIPSMRTLTAGLQIDGPTARIIREILQGKLDPCEVSPAAKAYRDACYHPPDRYMLKLYACNEILGSHGVEYVKPGRGNRSPGFEYLNMGDTYTTTLVRIDGGGYRITDWGSIVERGNYE